MNDPSTSLSPERGHLFALPDSGGSTAGGARLFLIMLAIGFSCIVPMNDLVIIPVADGIYRDFSGSGAAVLDYILSGPILIGAIFSLFCGRLADRFGKKNLLLLSVGIFAAAAILTDAVHDPWYMAAMRTLVGACMGVSGVAALSIISAVFVEEKMRSAMTGIYTASLALAGTALGWASGIAGAENWRNVFRIYFAALPVFVLILLFVPKDSGSAAAVPENGNAAAGNGSMAGAGSSAGAAGRGKLFLMSASYLLYSLVFHIVYYRIQAILKAKGFAAVETAGLASALSAAGSFAGSVGFGFYYGRLRRFTIGLGYALMAFCYWLLFSASAIFPLLLANTLLGASFGIGISYYSMYCTTIVPAGAIPLALGVAGAAMGIGGFLSTYCATALAGLLGAASVVAVIPVLVAVLAGGALLSLFLALRETRRARRRRAFPRCI